MEIYQSLIQNRKLPGQSKICPLNFCPPPPKKNNKKNSFLKMFYSKSKSNLKQVCNINFCNIYTLYTENSQVFALSIAHSQYLYIMRCLLLKYRQIFFMSLEGIWRVIRQRKRAVSACLKLCYMRF